MIVNTFIPKYMEKFKCIGSECTDTCCAGWDINIDENILNPKTGGSFIYLICGMFVLSFVSFYLMVREKRQ